jgi:hypothetical protein
MKAQVLRVVCLTGAVHEAGVSEVDLCLIPGAFLTDGHVRKVRGTPFLHTA